MRVRGSRKSPIKDEAVGFDKETGRGLGVQEVQRFRFCCLKKKKSMDEPINIEN